MNKHHFLISFFSQEISYIVKYIIMHYQIAIVKLDETFFIAGTEYFSAIALPRDHIPEFCLSKPFGNHTIIHLRDTDGC